MSCKGKIARLPGPIREQINQRLQDGENGRNIIAWLNSLDQVKAVTADQFAGVAITDCNLFEWRKGGYRDWEAQQTAMAQARQVVENGGELATVGGKKSLAESLAVWLTGRLMIATRQLIECEDQEESWKLLRELCHEVAVLRRNDHGAQWLRLEADRLKLLRQRNARERRKAILEEKPPLPPMEEEEKEQRFREIFGTEPV